MFRNQFNQKTDSFPNIIKTRTYINGIINTKRITPEHVAIKENLDHFYTYADNQAIGFFQKMGFIKKKTNNYNNKNKEVFWDYIKHYTGSELMECKLYSKVNYIQLDNNLLKIEKNILLQCENYRKNKYNIDFEKEYSDISFTLPINKLIVILELHDNFINENHDEKLIKVFEKYGIANDRLVLVFFYALRFSLECFGIYRFGSSFLKLMDCR